ncbi:MAG: hypothetical protein AABW50_03945 [Nanoarchaeota archaeon]
MRRIPINEIKLKEDMLFSMKFPVTPRALVLTNRNPEISAIIPNAATTLLLSKKLSLCMLLSRNCSLNSFLY